MLRVGGMLPCKQRGKSLCFFIQERRKLNEGINDVFGRVRKHFPRDSISTCKRRLGRGGTRVDSNFKGHIKEKNNMR